MGAGQFGAGLGGAGADPVYLAARPTPVLAPRAVKYDPSIRQLVLVDNLGNKTDVHPIDQIVAFRLTAEQGTSGSSPALGQRIRARFNQANTLQYAQIASDEVRIQLRDLLNAQDVQLISVTLTTQTGNGAQVVVVKYQNMRAAKANPTPVNVLLPG